VFDGSGHFRQKSWLRWGICGNPEKSLLIGLCHFILLYQLDNHSNLSVDFLP